MLYIEPNEYGEINDFIFNASPYNDDINLCDIAALESFFKKNGYIPERYIFMFLNYITYYARKMVVRPPDSPINSSFKGRCSTAASIIDELMSKMGFKVEQVNIGEIMNRDPVHQLAIVHIPTLKGDEKVIKSYVMDPTFRQFCLREENRYERYFEEPRFSVRMSTPHPGYFYALTKEGTKFANRLITYGYFEINDWNLKMYFDPFRLYLTPKEEYEEGSLGKISSTNLTGNYYRNRMEKCIEKQRIKSHALIETPMEQIVDKKRKMMYRIRNLFGMEDLYKSDLELEKEFTK